MNEVTAFLLSLSVQRRWPALLAFSAVGLAGWALFYTFITNQEKISSSVTQQSLRTVRGDDGARQVLGEAIRFQPEWWLNGDPRIVGSVRFSIHPDTLAEEEIG